MTRIETDAAPPRPPDAPTVAGADGADTESGRGKSAIREMFVTLGILLAFFAVFLGLLTLTFPEGTSLRNLVISNEPGQDFEDQGERGEFELQDGRQGGIATLLRTTNKVKDKSASGIAWGESESGMPLGSRHAVQTFEKSTAEIAFDGRNSLKLGPNSLVVLKSFDQRDDGSDRRANLLVVEGDLEGALSGSDTDSLAVEVETSSGIARIQSSNAAGPPATFRVKVNEDASSTIAVRGVRAEILTEQGSVVVEGNRMVTFSETAAPVVLDLPPAPTVLAPEDAWSAAFHAQTPQIEFRWREARNADAYRLVIARDAGFQQIEFEATVPITRFVHGNLPPGRYSWRVAAVRGGMEGEPSRTRRLRLVLDVEPPAMALKWPQDPVTTSRLVLEGRTDPGSQVFVGNDRIFVSESGDFIYDLELDRGVNMVTVEAIDSAGNSTYESKALFARY